MSLTFLSPLPALAVAAAAVPALLILYFLKLRRRPVRVSSTLLWEQATRDLQVNIPFRLIRPTWLLLLQLLILALFLLALARPALNTGGGARERVVLLIDRSASMSARDGGPGAVTRLDEARRRALATLDHLSRAGAGSSFAVVEFAAAPRIASAFTQDLGAARGAVGAIQPSDQPGDLSAALRLAGAMLAGEASESARPEPGLVVLFSDGGFPPPAEGYTLAGADFRYERIGATGGLSGEATPARAELPQSHDNLGIVALAARRDWDDPATVRLFLRIRNASTGPVAAPVSLQLDGVEIDRRAVEVPGGATPAPPAAPAAAPQTADPSHAEAVATFTLNRREGGILTVSIDRPDLLPSDNTASLVLEAASKPRLILVIPDPPPVPLDQPAGDDPPALPRGPEWIITTVLQEMQVPFRTMRASAYEREMAGDEPPQADLFIFDRVAPTRAPAAPSISFGAGLPSEGVALRPPPTDSPGTYILSWSRAHPLLRHVALDSVFISRPMTVAPAGARTGGAQPPSPPLTELARGAAGPLILLLDGPAARRVVVAFELAYSNWPVTVGFPIFLAQAVDHLTLRAAEHAGRFFTTAEPVSIEVEPGRTGTVILDGPARLERSAAGGQPTPAGLRRVNVGVVERAGVYRAAGVPGAFEPGSPTAAVAVNLLDPAETSLAVAGQIRVGGETVAGTGRGQEPLELWPHLVAVAGALLLVEWFLNAWFMRI